MAFTEPELLKNLLKKIAENIAQYAIFQIDAGAQAVQLFDSWAGTLSPIDYDVFAAPYQKLIIDTVHAARPGIPLILYISQGASLLERMAATGIDVIGVDWTVNLDDARKRIGDKVQVQGNMDPAVLLGSKETITERVHDIIKRGGEKGHIFNLGHGVLPITPEENVAHFFETVRNYRY
mmetsp:Transcript_19852/g.52784  ORF Transcript_19852/g.52784 Transcript_19852/m.52784 type:complete len:179 (-) Transcript_19852:145-681(-)